MAGTAGFEVKNGGGGGRLIGIGGRIGELWNRGNLRGCGREGNGEGGFRGGKRGRGNALERGVQKRRRSNRGLGIIERTQGLVRLGGFGWLGSNGNIGLMG